MGSEPLAVTHDLTPGEREVVTRPIVLRANHVTFDGHGATILGPGEPGNRDSYQGVGILAEGWSGVTLRNFRVRGFRVGLQVTDAAGWVIEDCDFSDNYTDPSAGWDVPGRFGGIILTRVCRSVLRRNKAQRVWNGLDLRDCHENVVTDNAFSHCSNISLKLWTSCSNLVKDNDLSYGLRIDPGEVHARDSAGILIESGSDDNTFVGNDVTHGGDGVFIRVLNGWVSRRNLFIENDCSYANNNGFEAWSPDNTYIRNKANHCSYGFWLGASDHTVLLGNEAAYNGQPDGFHNAPEKLFGHGGIVFVGGSSAHTVAAGNHCHHNHGAGIVVRGDVATRGQQWRASHWIIQNNRLESNRWGIHAQHADQLCLAANEHKDNELEDFLDNVARLLTLPPAPADRAETGAVPRLACPAVLRESAPSDEPTVAQIPVARLDGPSWAHVGEKVVFDASSSRDPAGLPLHFLWDIAEARDTLPRVSNPREGDGPRVEHVFQKQGFYRVALTVHNGHLADMAWRDVYVVREGDELGTEGSAEGWSFRMPSRGFQSRGRVTEGRVTFAVSSEALVGRSALEARVDPYPGGPVELLFQLPQSFRSRARAPARLFFWLRRRCEHYRSFDGPNPVVTLYGPHGRVTYAPQGQANRIDTWDNPSESRWGWLLFTIPLAGDEVWMRQEEGLGPMTNAEWRMTNGEGEAPAEPLEAIEAIGFQFQACGDEPLTIWLDGLAWE